jgi:V8-like Glu-specific endopeptidase
MKAFVFVAAALLLTSQLKANENIEKVIGRNDLVAVDAEAANIPYRYQRLVDAFGIINMGCTATHIGKGYVLTAGHCFDAPMSVVRDQECADVTVRWGVREGKQAYLESQCEKIVAAQVTNNSDFAIFKVSPVPEASVAVDIRKPIAKGFKVTIFSHPEELPLRWSQHCIVERRLDDTFSSQTLQHKCDTNPGSSGATIIDAFTNKVVGIHDGGYLSDYRLNRGMNYGTYLTNPDVVSVLSELGFR